jgi:hypothetical protein
MEMVDAFSRKQNANTVPPCRILVDRALQEVDPPNTKQIPKKVGKKSPA